MNPLVSILHIAAPLLLVTMGALISEYAGRMAMFLECMINIGAFFCYAFTAATHNLAAGMVLSVLCCTLMVLLFERTASHFHANMFLISLAMNMLFAALATLFSAAIFGTRGVLFGDIFKFDARNTRLATTILCYVFACAQIAMLRFTTPGLTLRITGSDSDMLSAQGISVARYRTLSWIFAAADGALCGCVLAARLSSYVPGMASGRGWTALAAVFLGRKRPLIVAFSVLAFALAEYASSTVQNIPLLSHIPSSLLLAFPYLLALFLIVAVPQSRNSTEDTTKGGV